MKIGGVTMLFAPKGNLVTNGDFEEGTPGAPPEGWISTNVTLTGPDAAFTGEQAALLGGTSPGEPAVLYQDVNVSPLRRYQLSVQLAAPARPAGDLIIEVRWLDPAQTDAGVGLHAYVPDASLGVLPLGVWDAQVHVTDCVPLGACMARILFTRSARPGALPTVMDAVTFADIG